MWPTAVPIIIAVLTALLELGTVALAIHAVPRNVSSGQRSTHVASILYLPGELCVKRAVVTRGCACDILVRDLPHLCHDRSQFHCS